MNFKIAPRFMNDMRSTFLSFFLATFSTVAFAQLSATDNFQKLLDDSWEFGLQEWPILATRTGDNRFNDKLASISVADSQRRLNKNRDFLKRLKNVDREKLSRTDQINYDIFGQMIENDISEAEFEVYLIPITNRWGFHVEFADIAGRVPLNNVKDYENYIARLNAFLRYSEQHIEIMRAGIEKGMVLPAVVLEGYKGMIEPHIVDDVTKSLQHKPFTSFPDKISQDDRKRLTAAGKDAITKSVVPGYQKFLKFMEKEYVPAARGSIGASALPRGREYYRHRVRWFSTLDITPDEVHQTGLSEVKRIRAEMHEVIKETDFKGDFDAFVDYLRTDPRFYSKTPKELMSRVALILKRMDGQLPRLFKTLPRTPYGLREIPSYIAPTTTSAYYTQPSGDGSRAGFYYLNTYNLKSRPNFEMEALSLHEAVPGHHLQLALQQEIKNIPNFRRFSNFTVFIEGWGLYAERLGLEVGFYTDPFDDFGRLSFEMWRACRLVVDTGMHYFGWTRGQAIDYMASNTSLSIHNIEAEVDRYISWPGQALAYKIGELKIRELRAMAENELGAKFDVREFHDVVLGSGAVPLSVLEENVKRFVESRGTSIEGENESSGR